MSIDPPGQHQVVLHDASARRWLHFHSPRALLVANRLDEVPDVLRAVVARVEAESLHAAGFIAYEASPAFDDALTVQEDEGFPPVWFGLYDPPSPGSLPRPAGDVPAVPPREAWQPSLSADAYRQAIAAIKAYIAAGHTYQVNFTYRLTAPFSGAAWPLFLGLAQAQSADYGAFVDTGRFAVCSASPELFFQLDGTKLTARPMKGTAARGLTCAQDAAQAEWLSHSEKDQAENVMIVDMLRNDMGRVAEIGSVTVPELFTVERYPTIWQMTSTVEAQTVAPLAEIIAALFPCASITGAPKRRTMEIIAELEGGPRRIYTGAIGFIAPGRRAQFNVAIRTVLIDRHEATATYGVGGGVVWDSTAEGEWEESRTKSGVLWAAGRPDFQLLETMLWRPDEGYFLLPYHLQRLQRSASYFDFAVDIRDIRRQLERFAETLAESAARVRLLLDRSGAATIEAHPLDSSAQGAARGAHSPRVCLAPQPVDSGNVFLYHKTTQREDYEQALASRPGYDDVVLWNEKGQVTESCFANVVVSLGGQRYTPPVGSGLLAGTYRQWLLDQGLVQERIITVADLSLCEGIWLVNSVRGEQPVQIDGVPSLVRLTP